MKVDIEFKNPLQIPISISNISLICELSTRSDEMESGILLSVSLLSILNLAFSNFVR